MQHTTHRQSHGPWDVRIPGWSVPGQWKQPRLVLKGFKLYETIQEPRLVATWLRCKLFTFLRWKWLRTIFLQGEIYGKLGRPHPAVNPKPVQYKAAPMSLKQSSEPKSSGSSSSARPPVKAPPVPATGRTLGSQQPRTPPDPPGPPKTPPPWRERSQQADQRQTTRKKANQRTWGLLRLHPAWRVRNGLTKEQLLALPGPGCSRSSAPCRPPAKGRRLHDWMRPFARPEGDLPRKKILRRELCPLRGFWLVATQDYYPFGNLT